MIHDTLAIVRILLHWPLTLSVKTGQKNCIVHVVECFGTFRVPYYFLDISSINNCSLLYFLTVLEAMLLFFCCW